jgi:hypothetical protein
MTSVTVVHFPCPVFDRSRPELVFTKLVLQILYIVCLTVWENAGKPDNLRIMIDFEFQGKKKEIHKLKYIAFKLYTVFYLLYFIKYVLSVNTNSVIYNIIVIL